MRADVDAESPPALVITSVENDPVHASPTAAIVRGTFEAPDYRSGSASAPGPNFVRDASGRPLRQRTRPVPFTLTLPRTTSPAPVPVVMYQHGNPGNQDEVIASARSYLSAAGFAAIAFTDILNREVAPTGTSEERVLAQLGFTVEGTPREPPGAGRVGRDARRADRVREVHPESRRTRRRGGHESERPAHRGRHSGPRSLAAAHLCGHQRGRELRSGPLALRAGDQSGRTDRRRGAPCRSHDPSTGSARPADASLASCAKLHAYRLVGRPVDLSDPLRWQDSHNHAEFLYRHPLNVAGTTRKASVLLVEGVHDSLVPNHATESLAWFLGPIPQLEPAAQPVAILAAAAGPIQGNIDAQTTAAFVQYVPTGVPGVPATPGCTVLSATQSERRSLLRPVCRRIDPAACRIPSERTHRGAEDHEPFAVR